ncbi:MAG: SIR2 family protein [Planctomycetes bacterium]|nr:SIR2 family protein [Planctomycetota bacterium]
MSENELWQSQSELINPLRQALVDKSVICMIGSGVSVASVRGSAEQSVTRCASWPGLLDHGIDTLAGFGSDAKKKAKEIRVELGKSENKPARLLKVAGELKQALGESEYGSWFRRAIDGLQVRDRTVLDAVKGLESPCVTTNYDPLLARALGTDPFAWTHSDVCLEVIRGKRKGVIHIHGYYLVTDSLVFDQEDYHRIREDQRVETILKALLTTKTVLFIGCGTGLEDPHFGDRLNWMATFFGKIPIQHYRLACEKDEVLDSESDKASRVHRINYGATHDSLGPFLRRLKSGHEGEPTVGIPRPTPLFCPMHHSAPAGKSTDVVDPAGSCHVDRSDLNYVLIGVRAQVFDAAKKQLLAILAASGGVDEKDNVANDVRMWPLLGAKELLVSFRQSPGRNGEAPLLGRIRDGLVSLSAKLATLDVSREYPAASSREPVIAPVADANLRTSWAFIVLDIGDRDDQERLEAVNKVIDSARGSAVVSRVAVSGRNATVIIEVFMRCGMLPELGVISTALEKLLGQVQNKSTYLAYDQFLPAPGGRDPVVGRNARPESASTDGGGQC